MRCRDLSCWIRLSLAITLLAGGSRCLAQGQVDFNRDIRPLLSNTCYQCHGPDTKAREAGLRFDQKDAAFAELESGGRAIVPGDRKQSKLFERISSSIPSLRMPPADSGKELSAQEIELMGRWIDQGAKWRGHWAFIPPERHQAAGNQMARPGSQSDRSIRLRPPGTRRLTTSRKSV